MMEKKEEKGKKKHRLQTAHGREKLLRNIYHRGFVLACWGRFYRRSFCPRIQQCASRNCVFISRFLNRCFSNIGMLSVPDTLASVYFQTFGNISFLSCFLGKKTGNLGREKYTARSTSRVRDENKTVKCGNKQMTKRCCREYLEIFPATSLLGWNHLAVKQ